MNKSLPYFAFIAIGFLLGLMVPKCERETKIVTETVTKIDTIIVRETPEPVIIDKPYPVYVTKYIPTEPDPTDFELDQLRIYKDSAIFDGLTLGYEIKTRGTLQSAVFRPTFDRETIYETTTITNTIDNTKKLRGLYIGLTVGGNKSEFGTLAPGLDYVAPKVIVGGNYNLMDATINVRVGRKLF